jgi:hypothetical protein
LSCLLSLVPFVLSPALLGECYKLRGGVRQLYDAGRGSCPRSERGPTLIASRVWVSTCVMSDRSNHHDTARVSFYTSLSHAVCPSIVARLVIASSAAALRRQLGTMQLPPAFSLHITAFSFRGNSCPPGYVWMDRCNSTAITVHSQTNQRT